MCCGFWNEFIFPLMVSFVDLLSISVIFLPYFPRFTFSSTKRTPGPKSEITSRADVFDAQYLKTNHANWFALTRNNMSVPFPNRTANTPNVITYFRWIINWREKARERERAEWPDHFAIQYHLLFLKIKPTADQNRTKPISVGCFYWPNALYHMMCSCARGMRLFWGGFVIGEKKSSFSTRSVMTHHLSIDLTDCYIIQSCYCCPK